MQSLCGFLYLVFPFHSASVHIRLFGLPCHFLVDGSRGEGERQRGTGSESKQDKHWGRGRELNNQSILWSIIIIWDSLSLILFMRHTLWGELYSKCWSGISLPPWTSKSLPERLKYDTDPGSEQSPSKDGSCLRAESSFVRIDGLAGHPYVHMDTHTRAHTHPWPVGQCYPIPVSQLQTPSFIVTHTYQSMLSYI